MSEGYKLPLMFTYVSRTALERAAIESDSLVDEDLCKIRYISRVSWDTCNLVRISPDHWIRLNTT